MSQVLAPEFYHEEAVEARQAYTPQPRMLIGVSGRKRHGKGAIADYLVARHGFVKIGFKDALLRCVEELNPIVGVEPTGGTTIPCRVRVKEVMHRHGYEAAKDRYPELVRIMQNYGTVIRSLDPDFWVRAAGQDIGRARIGRSVVVDDVRFPNEADAIRRWGGKLVRVTRKPAPIVPEVQAAHISEHALDHYRWFDYYVVNDGTLKELHGKVGALHAAITVQTR